MDIKYWKNIKKTGGTDNGFIDSARNIWVD